MNDDQKKNYTIKAETGYLGLAVPQDPELGEDINLRTYAANLAIIQFNFQQRENKLIGLLIRAKDIFILDDLGHQIIDRPGLINILINDIDEALK